MPDLIYSRKASNEVLTYGDLARQAPAAFAGNPIEGVSDQYGHVTTLDAVQQLGRAGWVPVQAAQTSSRTQKAREHTKHLIAFARESDYDAEGRPEIVLYNSSDRTSALKLYAGYFRWICSNSLISGSGFENKLIHKKSLIHNFEDLISNALDNLDRSSENIAMMQETEISADHAYHLAGKAADLRWKSLRDAVVDISSGEEIPAGTYWTNKTVKSLLERKRNGERVIGRGETYSLWDVFNRIQEGVMRSGAVVESITANNPRGAQRKARAIASVSQAIKINRNCWDLCEAAAA